MKGDACTFIHDVQDLNMKRAMLAETRSVPSGAFHPTYDKYRQSQSPGPLQMGNRSFGRRLPAPLNLNDNDENNLRPSPREIARSRPSSKSLAYARQMGFAPSSAPSASQPGFRFDNSAPRVKERSVSSILKGVLERDEQKSESDPSLSQNRYDEGGDTEHLEHLPSSNNSERERTFKFNLQLNDQMFANSEKEKSSLTPHFQKSPSPSPHKEAPMTPSKAFTRPCKYFAQGFCVKGAACTFLHFKQDSVALTDRLSNSSGQTESSSVDPSKMFVRLCRYYIKGQCAKGNECTFIHPTPEQLDAIKYKQNSASPSVSLPRTVDPPSRPQTPQQPVHKLTLDSIQSAPGPDRLMLNSVGNSSSYPLLPRAQSPQLCINNHVSPMRTSAPGISKSPKLPSLNGSLVMTNINTSKIKTKPCKFFQVGQCLKGDSCTFIHEKVAEHPRPLEEPVEAPDMGKNQRINSPRFQRVENRSYEFNELDDIEDYVAGIKDAPKSSVANSNVAAVVLTLDYKLECEISKHLTEIHNYIKKLNNDSEDGEYSDFLECHAIGCTGGDPETVADDIRRSALEFNGRRETLCQPRFAHILRALKRKAIIAENAVYLYQIEAVTPKYAYKYPYANVSMVYQKGDKGERIEQVAIRGLFEKEHVVLDRFFWDQAFKARAPPIYLPFYLTGEQLAKYPESRRVWFCGAHSLFVPKIQDAEFVRLEIGDSWPQSADVPSKYAAVQVPAPTLYIKFKPKSVPIEPEDETEV